MTFEVRAETGTVREKTYFRDPSKMSPKYRAGWVQGRREAEQEFKKQYCIAEITFPQIYAFIAKCGRVSLRRGTYPFITATVQFNSMDMFLLKSIFEKLRWSRIENWQDGKSILLVWEGAQAQILVQKMIRYIDQSSGVYEIARKILDWIPKGGKFKPIVTQESNFAEW